MSIGKPNFNRGDERHALGPDPCRPILCALATTPHTHCVCGLPMPIGATLCTLCHREGLVPTAPRLTDHDVEWDGRRYPARRRNRPAGIPAARYDDLLRVILGPGASKEAA